MVDTCLPDFTDIAWLYKARSGWDSLANNYDCYNYDSLKFGTLPTPSSGATVQWRFTLNGGTPIYKYGSNPVIKWSEFSPSLNPGGRVPIYCTNTFEVCVRQYIDSSCLGNWYCENAENSNCPYYKQIQGNANALSTNEVSLKVYPTVAKDFVTVQVKLLEDKTQTSYQIINASGIVIKKGILSTRVSKMNIADLSTGLYLLKTELGIARFFKQ